ncbi:MAG: hypothetical protein ACR2NX_03280 [Chthoniobacterales bacterium]
MKSKSTYSLLVDADSEEKSRSIFEVSVYVLIGLCMAVSGWNFATATVTVPGQNRAPASTERLVNNVPDPQPLLADRG